MAELLVDVYVRKEYLHIGKATLPYDKQFIDPNWELIDTAIPETLFYQLDGKVSYQASDVDGIRLLYNVHKTLLTRDGTRTD